jgi:hypothetical protein
MSQSSFSGLGLCEAKAERIKRQFSDTLNSGVLLQEIYCSLYIGVFQKLMHMFCPDFIVVFIWREMVKCVYFISPGTENPS